MMRASPPRSRIEHGAAVHERRRVTGDEDEDFGGVAEALMRIVNQVRMFGGR